jgi:RHS repeat-associated protein
VSAYFGKVLNGIDLDKSYPSLQYCHLSRLKRDHPDHLGSASWITDADGNGYQHLQYLPPDSYRDGETWVDQRKGTYSTPYQFSGKEKDEETGYSYFGARYYDSELSVWLSVDPMSDKYPSLNAYNYCSNNPLVLIDPQGEDIYDFDEGGNLVKITADKKIASFRVVDKYGVPIASTVEMNASDVTHSTPTINGSKTDIFEIKGDCNASDAFELFANYTNTEWTHAKIGTEGSERNIVGTSHNTGSTAIGQYLNNTKYTLRSVVHNHPSEIPLPSGQIEYNTTGVKTQDLLSAESYQKENPNVKLWIYTRKFGYSPYDKNGTKDPRFYIGSGGKYILRR